MRNWLAVLGLVAPPQTGSAMGVYTPLANASNPAAGWAFLLCLATIGGAGWCTRRRHAS